MFPPKKVAFFDTAKLRQWFETVAESYVKGMKLVKVTMAGEKILRTVQVKDDVRKFSFQQPSEKTESTFTSIIHFSLLHCLAQFFAISRSHDRFRSTHMSYIEKITSGWTSGEFMRLIEITEEGTEM